MRRAPVGRTVSLGPIRARARPGIKNAGFERMKRMLGIKGVRVVEIFNDSDPL